MRVKSFARNVCRPVVYREAHSLSHALAHLSLSLSLCSFAVSKVMLFRACEWSFKSGKLNTLCMPFVLGNCKRVVGRIIILITYFDYIYCYRCGKYIKACEKYICRTRKICIDDLFKGNMGKSLTCSKTRNMLALYILCGETLEVILRNNFFFCIYVYI